MPKNPAAFAFACNAAPSPGAKAGSCARSRVSTSGSSGSSSFLTKVRTHSRISRCSSVRVKSIAGHSLPDPAVHITFAGQADPGGLPPHRVPGTPRASGQRLRISDVPSPVRH
jgi:hypothetical protein